MTATGVYHDLPIARNTYLMMCALTAQRDPRVFRDGQRFDITIRRSEQPLQFGGGPNELPLSFG